MGVHLNTYMYISLFCERVQLCKKETKPNQDEFLHFYISGAQYHYTTLLIVVCLDRGSYLRSMDLQSNVVSTQSKPFCLLDVQLQLIFTHYFLFHELIAINQKITCIFKYQKCSVNLPYLRIRYYIIMYLYNENVKQSYE